MKSFTKIKVLRSNHLLIRCKINNVYGNFILDSGASNSCVNLKKANKFKIAFKKCNERASSATNHFDEIFISEKITLKINDFEENDFKILLFDMTHISKTLSEKEDTDLDGIIGGDILIDFDAIINYKKKILVLNF